MYLAAEPWIAVREEKKAELVGRIAEMDAIYLPIVGRKQAPPAQEEVDAARKVWESFDTKTEEEIAIPQPRSCRKDPERKAALPGQHAEYKRDVIDRQVRLMQEQKLNIAGKDNRAE